MEEDNMLKMSKSTGNFRLKLDPKNNIGGKPSLIRLASKGRNINKMYKAEKVKRNSIKMVT